jgi:hypothetical protein
MQEMKNMKKVAEIDVVNRMKDMGSQLEFFNGSVWLK